MTQISDDCFIFGDELLPLAGAWEVLNQKALDISVNKNHNMSEKISIKQSYKRIICDDLMALKDVPGFANSAVDGYAIKAHQLTKDKDNRFDVIGPLEAGGKLSAEDMRRVEKGGVTLQIFTGAAIPCDSSGHLLFDTIYMQEDCVRDKDGKTDKVTLPFGLKKGSNLRNKDDDISAGTLLISAGKRLEAVDLAICAGQGLEQLDVYKKLRVAIFSTGNELQQAQKFDHDISANRQIYDSNRPLIAAIVEGWGLEVIDCGILTDNLSKIIEAFENISKNCDLIITSGGMSVGGEDHLSEAIKRMGQLDFCKVAIKPGRPTGFGMVAGEGGQPVPILGLPGNPAAVFTTLTILARPFIKRLMGEKVTSPNIQKIKLGFDYKKRPHRREFIRVRKERVEFKEEADFIDMDFHEEHLVKHGKSGAGVLSSLLGADGFLMLDEETTELTAGSFGAFISIEELLR